MSRSSFILAISVMVVVSAWISCSQSNSPVSVATNYTELPAEQAKELQKVLKAKSVEHLPNKNLTLMKDYLVKKLLENPAPWGIDLRGNYFWNIYNALPSFVSARDRHTGYNISARDYTPEEQLMAYAIWRIDRRPDNIRKIYEFAKPTLKRIVPESAYSAWGIEAYVNDALQAYHQIADIPNFSKLLQNAYSQADTTTGSFMWEGNSQYFRSFENSAYGFSVDELNQIISGHLNIDKHNTLATSPWLSFWMRRNHEGNMLVVYEILNDINGLYNAPQVDQDYTRVNKSEKTTLNHKGRIVYLKEWVDSAGDNVLILSEETLELSNNEGPSSLTTNLYAYHYANAGKGYELINMISESQQNCDFENRARFMEESFTITDVNGNGYSEVVFTYRLGCSSEISPDRLVLIAMENGSIYTINGTTRVTLDKSTPAMGGETAVGDEFEKAPKKLLAHAKAIWKVQQDKHDNFYKPRFYQLDELKRFHSLTLFGVEPFWDITLSDTKLVISQPSEEPRWFEYNRIDITNQGIAIEASATNPGETIYITFSEGSCSDGMSDNTHPYKATLTFKGNTYEGCGRWKK